MIDATLVTRAVALDRANLRLGHTVHQEADATFVVNPALPDIHDANHVADVHATTLAGIDALFARMEHAYAHCAHRQILCGPDTAPLLEARLTLEAWGLERTLVMLLEGRLVGDAPVHTIRGVATAADWDAYARLKRLEWREHSARLGLDLPHIGEGLIAAYRSKVPPLRYWLALVDDEPRGYMSSWEGPDGIGQVEDLFVEAPFRHRGLATALIHHAVADARAHGAGPVVIVSDATDTPKTMYAAMGFVPVAVTRKYTRRT
jgi:GNAT superfamily N-acetyltransferase